MSLSVPSSTIARGGDRRRERKLPPRQRALAGAAVTALHVVVVGALAAASLRTKAPPPTPTIMVSMVADAVADARPQTQAAPPPPAPVEPAPQPKVLAAPRPTASPMTAPPPEAPQRPVLPQPAAAPSPPASAGASASASAAGPAATSVGPAGITPPNFRAAYLNNPGPQYPYVSRRKREEGTVKLEVHVSASGRPDQVQVKTSSGFPALDAAALDIVKTRWRFEPARQGDKAVAAWVVVPLEFSLKDR